MSDHDHDLPLIADAVAVHLRRGYAERSLRSGASAPEVDDRDYADLLRIEQRVGGGGVPEATDLDRLEQISRSSPRFLEGHLLASHVAVSLFTSTHVPGYLERALAAARDACALAPGDPRARSALFQAAIVGKRTGVARRSLADLARIIPSDPDLYRLASLLAQSQGDLKQAIAEMEIATRHAPSWTNLFRLAGWRSRRGGSPTRAATWSSCWPAAQATPGPPLDSGHLGILTALGGIAAGALAGAEAGGNVTRAAELLGLQATYLHRLINKLDLRTGLRDGG